MMRKFFIVFSLLAFMGVTSAMAENPMIPSKAALKAEYIRALLPLPAGVISKGLKGTDARQVIMNLQFEKNKANLKEGSFVYLDALGEAIKSEPTLKCNKFIVEGHTCDLGPASYNKKLSYLRAKAVVDYLVNKFHFNERQFEIVAYGESRPLVPNISEENRKKNRRVVIKNTMQKLAKCEGQTDIRLSDVPAKTWIERLNHSNGLIERVKDYVMLSDDDGYAINIVPNKNLYVYAYKVNGDKIERLYPNQDYYHKKNPITAKKLIRIPSYGQWFYPENTNDEEVIVILARKTPLSKPLLICKSVMGKSYGNQSFQVASNKINFSRGIDRIETIDSNPKESISKDNMPNFNNNIDTDKSDAESIASSTQLDDSGQIIHSSSPITQIPKDVFIWKMVVRHI